MTRTTRFFGWTDITATRENLSAVVDLLCEARAENVSLLPYYPMGIEMSVSLGRPPPSLPREFMKPDEEKELYFMFKRIIENRRDQYESGSCRSRV